MKKLSVLILSMLFVSTLVGCGLFSGEEEVSATPTPSPTSSPDVSEDDSSLDEDSSTDEESKDEEDSSKDEEKSEEDSSLDGLNSDEMDLSAFHEDLKAVYGEDYQLETELDSTQLQERLGLSSDLYDEIYAHTKEGSPEIFVAVRAKPGASGDVERALSTYKDSLAMDEAYADKADMINSAKIHVEGDYVFMLLVGTESEASADLDAHMQKGIDEIKKRFE